MLSAPLNRHSPSTKYTTVAAGSRRRRRSRRPAASTTASTGSGLISRVSTPRRSIRPFWPGSGGSPTPEPSPAAAMLPTGSGPGTTSRTGDGSNAGMTDYRTTKPPGQTIMILAITVIPGVSFSRRATHRNAGDQPTPGRLAGLSPAQTP